MINHPNLIEFDYDYVHFDSPDRRGIDVALIYRRGHFTPTNSTSNRLLLFEDDLVRKSRIYTRDQLVVSGELGGEPIQLVINHWPSRRGGKKSSQKRRLAAAKLTRRLCDSIFTVDRYAKIIVMGDFNDDPSDLSIQYLMRKADGTSRSDDLVLRNPISELFRKGYGTLAYRDGWNLFDQILLSPSMVKGEASSWKLFKIGIHNHPKLVQKKGRFKGYPRRGMHNDQYIGGYSDHFPVYVYLVRIAK
jgi:endonuclease/exonuclease/phosphatase family metal-dependent hydrolase